MYRKRMLGYYPNVIKSISEFNAIIDTESTEIESLNAQKKQLILDAYLPTMSERRVIQWENNLGVQPFYGSTLEDRKNNIIARIRGQGKLNTNLINTIVKTFTGSGCKCYIENNTLYVYLLPFDDSAVSVEDLFTNISNELALKIPAHLGLNVNLAYLHWAEVMNNNNTWVTVRATHGTWEDVKFGNSHKANMLDTSKLDEFYLG